MVYLDGERDVGEIEEFEYDLAYNPNESCFFTNCIEGKYLLYIKFKDYQEINEVVNIGASYSKMY